MSRRNLLNAESRIPAHQVCPFREECELAKAGNCGHQGENHTVPYSCAAARFYEMFSDAHGGTSRGDALGPSVDQLELVE